MLQDFGASLERSIDPADLLPHVAEAVREGLGASWVRVSLRVPDLATTYPTYAESGTVVGPPTLGQDLRRGGELVGRIDCGPKDGGYDEADRALLDTLAGQAATAVANVWLTAQLSERVRQLDSVTSPTGQRPGRGTTPHRARHPRRRAAGAGGDADQGRPGAQPARSRTSARAAARPSSRPTPAKCCTDLRELAQGIHPSVLSDNGLVAALGPEPVGSRSPSRCGPTTGWRTPASTPTSRARRTSWSARR